MFSERLPRPRGRFWLVAWLLFVLGVLWWVSRRQAAGFTLSAELDDLRARRSVLEARRAALSRRIREAESRAVLIPRAEALGLRFPADSEIVILPMLPQEGR